METEGAEAEEDEEEDEPVLPSWGLEDFLLSSQDFAWKEGSDEDIPHLVGGRLLLLFLLAAAALLLLLPVLES